MRGEQSQNLCCLSIALNLPLPELPYVEVDRDLNSQTLDLVMSNSPLKVQEIIKELIGFRVLCMKYKSHNYIMKFS